MYYLTTYSVYIKTIEHNLKISRRRHFAITDLQKYCTRYILCRYLFDTWCSERRLIEHLLTRVIKTEDRAQ
jgi:hypothetical protein